MNKRLNLKDSKIVLNNKIAILKFNRHDVRNALTGTELISDIISTIDFLNQNLKFSVLIITGNGSSFSSGGNIKEMFKKNSSFSGKVEEVEKNIVLEYKKFLKQLIK